MAGCPDCLELAAEDLEEDNEHWANCLHCQQETSARNGVEWRRVARAPCPALPGRPDGNEQQGLEAGFEQKAGRKRLDVFAHVDSLRVVLEGLSGFHRMAHAIKAPPAG